ncbi:hypothetical protein SELMODRAFT_408106 [Selaginella moellendorffii]|uniref:Uncharacterized protein n=1 Tax=Selaginella moellendorffii TaxID=88036 RepID=D8R776_SELML|nr:hypothetical protein SELMODRAFT_408106 [Selaginella moellendorffii]
MAAHSSDDLVDPGFLAETGLDKLVSLYTDRIDKNGQSSGSTAFNLSGVIIFLVKNGFSRRHISDAFRAQPCLFKVAYDQAKFDKILAILRELGDEKQVHRIVRIVPQVVAQDPASLSTRIASLGRLGIGKSDIPKRPILLTVEDLEEKTRLVCSLGVSRKAFGLVLQKSRGAATLSLEMWKIKLAFVAERSVVGKNLERILLRYPWFFKSSNVTMEECMPLFKRHGLDGERMAQMVAWYPGSLRSAATLPAREDVLRSAGLSRSARSYKSALSIAALTKMEIIPERLERMSAFGFSTAQVHEMFRKQPRILRVGDESLKLKMRFLLDCVKLPREKMLKSPTYMLYSLEKRLRPRFRVAALVLLSGLMRQDVDIKWKGVFYYTNASFRKMVLGWNPAAVKIYDSVIKVKPAEKKQVVAKKKQSKTSAKARNAGDAGGKKKWSSSLLRSPREEESRKYANVKDKDWTLRKLDAKRAKPKKKMELKLPRFVDYFPAGWDGSQSSFDPGEEAMNWRREHDSDWNTDWKESLVAEKSQAQSSHGPIRSLLLLGRRSRRVGVGVAGIIDLLGHVGTAAALLGFAPDSLHSGGAAEFVLGGFLGDEPHFLQERYHIDVVLDGQVDGPGGDGGHGEMHAHRDLAIPFTQLAQPQRPRRRRHWVDQWIDRPI